MRCRTVIFTLSVAVVIICATNLFQIWLMVKDCRGLSEGRSVIWNHRGSSQVISGSKNESNIKVKSQEPDHGAQKAEARNLMNNDSIGYIHGRAESGFSRINVTWASGGTGAKPNCILNSTRAVYQVINGTKRYVPQWQRKLEKCGKLGYMVNRTRHFDIAVSIQVRIYETDKAKWTIKELKQWMHFMFLIGVEHVFLCDHFKSESEKLDMHLKRYIDLGLVTYIPWSDIRNPMNAQLKCYQNIIDSYKHLTQWQIAIDMDEYPFALTDYGEGFMSRYLQNMTAKYGTRVTEISMSNFLMLGQGDRKQQMTISRINRMKLKPANGLVKPIYRPERVTAGVHHNHLLSGSHHNADTNTLRMLHYWGARGQDWGPDTPHTLNITREMNDMRDTWTRHVRDSLIVFGEMDAFSNTTGP